MLAELANLVTRRAWLVIGLWLLAILTLSPLTLRVGSVLTNDSGTAPGSVATEVRAVLRDEFAGSAREQLLLVTRPAALARPGELNAVLDELAALDAVDTLVDYRNSSLPLKTARGETISILTLLATTPEETEKAVATIAAALPKNDYLLTGGAATEAELSRLSARDLRRAERYGLPLSFLVLLIGFGSVVAAGLPLVTAVVSVVIALALLYLVGLLTPVASFAQLVITMLGLATGTDYALLMVNRFRKELRAKHAPAEATRRTLLSAGESVATSGLTTLIAMTSLLVPPLPFVRSIGLAGILIMLVSVSVSLTLLPACLTLLGARVNALTLSRRELGTRGYAFWQARALSVTQYPAQFAALGFGLLTLLALPTLGIQIGVTGARGLSETTTTRQAFDILEEAQLDGLVRSYDLLIDFGERGFYHPRSVRQVARLSRAAQDLAGVEQVLSSSQSSLPALLTQQYYATEEAALGGPLAPLVRQTVSEGGRYALLRVFPSADTPPRERALVAEALRLEVETLELDARLGGGYVAEADWGRALYRALPVAALIVYLATFVLLLFMLRSVVIALKAIVLNTLTVLAALGVVTAVFQYGFGAALVGVPESIGFVDTSVPFFIFAILFGVSMDYEVFLMSRMIEAHREGRSDREAIVYALSRTGGVITSAALIMFVVFAAFVLSEVVLVKSLSVGLSAAVLLDATLVRLVLVPSITLLAGRWNWWLPRPLRRSDEL